MNTATPHTNGKPQDVREAAREFRRRGFYSIPLPARSKKLTDSDWEMWRIGEAEIDARFATGCNIGVLLGEPSAGIVDTDLDSPEAIRAAPILLPDTDMISGRQSAPMSHWWYRVKNPPAKASGQFLDPTNPNKSAGLLLEFRSTGGQTVVPPSVYPIDVEKGHPTAEPCVWHRHGEPARVDLDVLRTAVRGLGAASLLGRHWPTGARHDASLALAGGLLRAAWPDEMIERFVEAVCSAAGDREVRDRLAAVRSSSERLRNGEHATGWPTLANILGTNGDAVTERVCGWLGIVSGTRGLRFGGNTNGQPATPLVWPSPIPLTIAPSVPSYPIEVLSPWLRDWAEAVALELQIPVDLPAGLGLGLLAAGIARKVVVSPRAGFTEPTNLFVMVALPPGDRKTQTFRRAITPVQKLQREAREAAEPAIIEAESEHRIAEKRVKHLEDKIAKAEPGERETLQNDLKDAREELAKAEVPPKPVFYTEDDTPESLKLELIRQGGRMVVASTEARCLENITLYNDKPNFDVYLKGHAGDEMNSGRVGRGRDMVTEPALSCILAPQPAVLQGLAEDEILRGRGFLARWLYALPESRVGFRTVAAPSVPVELLDGYERRIRAAWKIGYAQDATGNTASHIIRFAADAAAEFEAFERWIEPQFAPGLPLAWLAGWANKLNGECARLAASLHVADTLGTGQSWDVPIPVGVVRRAIHLCRDYLIAHAVAAFDLMGADVTLSRARRVWSWITEHKLTEFKLRDCFRSHQSVFETVDDLQPCLELLERHYLIRARDQQRAGRGRPTSPVYDVNPNTDGEDDSPESDNHPPYAPSPNSVTSVISVTGYGAGGEFRLIATAAGISDVVTAIEDDGGMVGLDCETTSLDHVTGRIRLLQLATVRGTFLIDLFQIPDHADSLAELFEVLSNAGIIGHNLGFDLGFLMRLGFVPGRVADTMLASQIVHAGDITKRHGLKDVAARVLNVTLDKENQKAKWGKTLTPEMLRYAARDAEIVVALWAKLKAEATAANLGRVLDIEMAALTAVAWASLKGVGHDRQAWEQLTVEAETHRDQVREQLDALAPAANLTGTRN